MKSLKININSILQPIKNNYPFVIILIIAAAINCYLYINNPNFGGDAYTYHLCFKNFIEGNGYTQSCKPCLRNPPGYAIITFILNQIIGDIEISSMLVSSLAYFFSIVIIYYIIKSLYGRHYAFLSAFFVAFSPVIISYSFSAITDLLYIFLLLTSFTFFIKSVLFQPNYYRASIFGFLLGFNYLTRHEGLPLGILLIILLIIFNIINYARDKDKDKANFSFYKRLSYPLITAIFFIIISFSYIYYNYSISGKFTVSDKLRTHGSIFEPKNISEEISGDDDSMVIINKKIYTGEMLKYFNMLKWQLNDATLHAIIPLIITILLFIFFFYFNLLLKKKIIINWNMEYKNIVVVLSLIAFFSPILTYIYLMHVNYRYTMQYTPFVLIATALIIIRLMKSISIKKLTLLTALAVFVSGIALSGLLSNQYQLNKYSSIVKTINEHHAHLGIRAAGFWLKANVKDIRNKRIASPRKATIILFYSYGKKIMPKNNIYVLPDVLSLENITKKMKENNVDYFILDNHYTQVYQQFRPLWKNPATARNYGLKLLIKDSAGLFQIYQPE